MNCRLAKNCYLSRHDGIFNNTLLSGDGNTWIIQRHEFSSDPVEVMVPKECFAKEPSQWEKNWVNHFFKNKCDDQCHFRKRRIFAYTIQPFILLSIILLRLFLLLVALIVGMRTSSLKYIIHPMTYNFSDVMDMFSRGSVFIAKLPPLKENKSELFYYFKLTWKLIFCPITLFFIIGSIYNSQIYYITFITILTLMGLALAVLILFFFSEYKYMAGLIDDYIASHDDNKAWYMSKKEIDIIQCISDKKIKSVYDLPKQHRTFKLKFLDLKSKVCRPFSK
jgi:hypothetical protein